MNNAAKTKTLTTNEVYRAMVGTRSECLAKLEDLFSDGKIDTKTFREVEAFFAVAGEPA